LKQPETRRNSKEFRKNDAKMYYAYASR